MQATLNSYKSYVENEITKDLEVFSQDIKLFKACEYALTNGGKRLRPILSIMLSESLKNGLNVIPAALAIEYFHVASLIGDDLPCMDNEEIRRNQPCVHKIHGETVALLASYALIARGYHKIAENVDVMKKSKAPFVSSADTSGVLALNCAAHNTGILGATGGQFWDLFPPHLSEEVVSEILYRKTGALFEAALLMGWIFGGGDHEKLDDVKKMARHFGLAFQIADDLDDMEQDKAAECQVNYALCFGEKRAESRFYQELEGFQTALKILDLHDSTLAQVGIWLSKIPCKS